MKKPKFLYLSTSLNIGGSEKFLITLVNRLKSEYEISVGYLKDRGHFGDLLANDSIETVHFTSPWHVASYLRKNQTDIIHTFLYRANIYGRIAGKIAGTPTIISTQQAIDKWKPTYLMLIDRFTFKWCDLLIVNSQTAKDSVQKREKFNSEKVSVVYNGINFESFNTNKSKEDIRKSLNLNIQIPIIISVGRLHREKGMDLLPDIAKQVNNCTFLVVGEGPERNYMLNKIQKLGIENQFVFLGWRHDIPELLKASDIFLLPSREESFPQAILEAMAMKLPVVASDIGGVKELIENKNNGILVNPGYLDEFSDALNYLLINTEEAKLMGKNGYNKAGNFSETNMINNINLIYKKLLSRRR